MYRCNFFTNVIGNKKKFLMAKKKIRGEGHFKAFQYKLLNSTLYTNTKLIKWVLEQMIFVVSAKVSLNY